MCKEFIKIYCENYIFILLSNTIPFSFWESISYLIILKGIKEVDSVLSDIMNVEGGMMCQMLVSLTKSFDEMIESIKKIIILIDWLRCRNLSRGVEKIDGQELVL